MAELIKTAVRMVINRLTLVRIKADLWWTNVQTTTINKGN